MRFQIEEISSDMSIGVATHVVVDTWANQPFRHEICYCSYLHAVAISRCLNLVNSAEQELAKQRFGRDSNNPKPWRG